MGCLSGSPILLDVYGKPRTRYGLRTIGAVQPASAPGPLPLAGATGALGWSRRLRRASTAAAKRDRDQLQLEGLA